MNMTADDNFQLISSPVRVKLGKGIHEISVKVNGGTVSLSRIMLLKKSGAARSIFLRLSSALIAAFIILPVAVKKTVSAIFSHRRRKSNAMHAYGL